MLFGATTIYFEELSVEVGRRPLGSRLPTKRASMKQAQIRRGPQGPPLVSHSENGRRIASPPTTKCLRLSRAGRGLEGFDEIGKLTSLVALSNKNHAIAATTITATQYNANSCGVMTSRIRSTMITATAKAVARAITTDLPLRVCAIVLVSPTKGTSIASNIANRTCVIVTHSDSQPLGSSIYCINDTACSRCKTLITSVGFST